MEEIMENVSKALIIAGEVLIAVLVMSLAAVLIVKFGQFSSNVNSQISQNKKAQFNNHFYDLNGRINITADEVATLINFVKESNDSYEIDLKNTSNSILYANIKINYNTANISEAKSFFSSKYITNEIGSSNEISKYKFKDVINNFLKEHNEEYFYCNADVTKIVQDPNDSSKKIIYVKILNNGINVNSKTGYVDSISLGLSKNLKNLKNSYDDYINNVEKYSIEVAK